MTVGEAMQSGRKQGKAIRRSSWAEGVFVYHGMDNLMMLSDREGSERVVIPDAATFLADDWELAEHPYHGKLAEAA